MSRDVAGGECLPEWSNGGDVLPRYGQDFRICAVVNTMDIRYEHFFEL